MCQRTRTNHLKDESRSAAGELLTGDEVDRLFLCLGGRRVLLGLLTGTVSGRRLL